MKHVIDATIKFKITENHPDIEYVEDWNKNKEYEFSDTYIMDDDYFEGKDSMEEYIKGDLMLVAGGGYDADEIKDVKFNLNWEE